MQIRSRHVTVLLTLLAGVPFMAQQPGYRSYFRSPIVIPVILSGSFGEIRRNHFHSGIDIRTDGQTGKPVYSAADGYVSRVVVSPGGFGKALYIAHPNGYTTVYGHLKSFAGSIGAWVKVRQYRDESFVIDTEIPRGILNVKKGDLIALSGNSGASAGPHLHFEIRDSKTQEVLDPLAFGIPHADKIPPKISWVKIYPYNNRGTVNGSKKSVMIPVTGFNGRYRLKMEDTIEVSGDIIFGIETVDFTDESGLKNGVQSITLTVDGLIWYSHVIDRFAFAETRYVNSLLDYPAFVQNGRKIQRSYIAPNNHLTIYKEVKNHGIVHFGDRNVHQIVYTVGDVYGNKSNLSFVLKSNTSQYLNEWNEDISVSKGTLVSWQQVNHFEEKDIRLTIPGEALYEDLLLEYLVQSPVNGSFASVHCLHHKYTPLHTWCDLYISPVRLPVALQSKAVIVHIDNGKQITSVGGVWKDGWIHTRIREFGNYTVMIDTIPPTIRPINIFSGKKISKQYSIMMSISDNLSGIRSYRGTLNGKWILMDYDEKYRLLVYSFDEHLKPGKNTFRLVVADAVGNKRIFEAVLIR